MPRMAKTTRAPRAREGARYHREDSYAPRGGCSEPIICPACNSIYSGKKWSQDKKLAAKAKKDPCLKYAKCPACQKMTDKFATGIVEISGDFLLSHKDDIISAIKSAEKHAIEKNPLERIISIKDNGRNMVVETTSDQLALRIGRHLFNAYHGDVDYKFSKAQKSVRVLWSRE